MQSCEYSVAWCNKKMYKENSPTLGKRRKETHIQRVMYPLQVRELNIDPAENMYGAEMDVENEFGRLGLLGNVCFGMGNVFRYRKLKVKHTLFLDSYLYVQYCDSILFCCNVSFLVPQGSIICSLLYKRPMLCTIYSQSVLCPQFLAHLFTRRLFCGKGTLRFLFIPSFF